VDADDGLVEVVDHPLEAAEVVGDAAEVGDGEEFVGPEGAAVVEYDALR
jgi:hypothetical protein